MALQDGLLSFTIKETIFLSSDRAGIGDLQELELVPDVEVLENQSYVSITGCLQLYGKYEPIRDTAEPTSGGTETLVEAMSFSPLRLDASERAAYGLEEQIGHRIPLNITIPVERIAQMGDIYAVVDSFDYKLESPHQMLVEAELKIAGIHFADPAEERQQETNSYDYSYEAVPANHEDVWDYSHVAVEQTEELTEPATLEEIEEKLNALEQEMERDAQPIAYESQDSPSLFDTPAVEMSSHQMYTNNSFGEVTEDEAGNSDSSQYESWNLPAQVREEDSSTFEHVAAQNGYNDQYEYDQQEEELDAPVLAIHDEQEVDYTSVADQQPAARQEESAEEGIAAKTFSAEEEQESQEVLASAQEEEEADSQAVDGHVEEVEDEEVASEADAAEVEVSAEPEVQEEAEVRVAISGKPSREKEGNLNITSIFSHASKARQEAEAQDPESSSSSSKKAAVPAANASTLEAMQNLSAFARSREERTSQMKLCIIQKEETLEVISQRYSLPVSRLVEVNRLTSDQLVAGQILYIPQ
ncbi:peptidoglycan-binding protein LysM [Brevibacillus panacihumi W25]|uniref:Peptidoglycan-binding protein LysM n=1 Tax=Brevibacillus panacihumi W25 TaxID=1408254 RepID=V6MED7_9BACL|nr:LysM peptidoglycan-binding domain-containing protein [Brevibacillus panacihumi]EST56592.1 peptidoglycan-binding protein LysM [Brevibacillus panacihumi W25]